MLPGPTVDKIQYTARIRTERERLLRKALFLPLVGLAFVVFAIVQVKTAFLFPIPSEASRYLLDTGFTKLSYQTLRTLLGESQPIWKPPVLLFIYWGYFVCGFLTFLVSPMLSLRILRSFPAHARGFITVADLKEAVARYETEPTRRNRWRLYFRIRTAGLYSLIVPLQYRWFKKPRFQWFARSALPTTEIRIVDSLARFADAMETFLKKNGDLQRFSKPLLTLEDFFFEIAKRAGPFRRSPKIAPNRKRGEEKSLLERFGHEVRPLLLEAARLQTPDRRVAVRFQWFRRITSSKMVRNSAALSVVSAFVMALGTLLFKITLSQAFLTWFTVAFGSLTISVGVTAFSLHYSRRQENRPDQAEAD